MTVIIENLLKNERNKPTQQPSARNKTIPHLKYQNRRRIHPPY